MNVASPHWVGGKLLRNPNDADMPTTSRLGRSSQRRLLLPRRPKNRRASMATQPRRRHADQKVGASKIRPLRRRVPARHDGIERNEVSGEEDLTSSGYQPAVGANRPAAWSTRPRSAAGDCSVVERPLQQDREVAVSEGGHTDRLPAVSTFVVEPRDRGRSPLRRLCRLEVGKGDDQVLPPRAARPPARAWRRSASTPRSIRGSRWTDRRLGRTRWPAGRTPTSLERAVCTIATVPGGGAVRCRRRRAQHLVPTCRAFHWSLNTAGAPARRGRRDKEGTTTSRDGRCPATSDRLGRSRGTVRNGAPRVARRWVT